MPSGRKVLCVSIAGLLSGWPAQASAGVNNVTASGRIDATTTIQECFTAVCNNQRCGNPPQHAEFSLPPGQSSVTVEQPLCTLGSSDPTILATAGAHATANVTENNAGGQHTITIHATGNASAHSTFASVNQHGANAFSRLITNGAVGFQITDHDESVSISPSITGTGLRFGFVFVLSTPTGDFRFGQDGLNGIPIPDTLPRSSAQPPGFYSVQFVVSDDAFEDQGNTLSMPEANFDMTLTVTVGSSTPNTEFHWTAGNGDYSVADNWDPQQVPVHDSVRNDTAIFGRTVDGNGNQLSGYAIAASGATAGRFVIDGAELNLDGDARVFEPSVGRPSLAISNDGGLILDQHARLSCVHASIGNGGAGTARVNLTDDLTELTCSGRIDVGELSGGRLSVTNAHLRCADGIVGDAAHGTAILNGSNTRWDTETLTIGAVSDAGELEVKVAARVVASGDLLVGDRTTGTLKISADGFLSARNAIIGAQSGSSGTVTITDAFTSAGSTLEIDESLRVGRQGDGTLETLDGASVHANRILVGGENGSGRLSVRGTATSGAASDLIATSSIRVGAGTFEILDGASADAGTIEFGGGGDSLATIRGFASRAGTLDTTQPATLTAADRITVGVDHRATLTVETGGSIEAKTMNIASVPSSGSGRLVLRGPQTDNGAAVVVHEGLRISGGFSDGSAEVTDGALLSAGTLTIGDEQTQDPASLFVRGASDENPSRLRVAGSSTSATIVGGHGPGLLALESGATSLHDGPILIGDGAGGHVSLTSKGVTDGRTFLQANDRITVGKNAGGTLSLFDGALATCAGDLVIADAANGGGFVEVTGSFDDNQAVLVIGGRKLIVGDAAHGGLNIAEGGRVNCNDAVVGGANGGDGLVILSGNAELIVSGSLDVARPGPGVVKLLSRASTVRVSVLTVINAGGRIEGVGTLESDGIANLGGVISPGVNQVVAGGGRIKHVDALDPARSEATSSVISPGTLTLSGDYEQGDGGTLIIETVSSEPGQFGVLRVSGNATLGGTLEVRTLNGFLPRAGDRIEFMDVAGIVSGGFARISFPDLADGFDADLSLTTDGKLRLTARNDATPGAGTTVIPAAAFRPAPAVCGLGTCGAGSAAILPLMMFGARGLRGRMRRRMARSC